MPSSSIAAPAEPAAPAWHRLEAGEVAGRLGVDPAVGLAAAEIEQRRARHGRNELREGPRRSPLWMLLDQFRDFMILVLIAAAVISGFIGEVGDTVAIVVIVVLNGIVGFVQEYRAERAVASLRQMAAPSATARRDGRACSLPAAELVPGDAVLLEAGQVVPADVRLLEAAQFSVEEAALTGESVAIEKDPRPLASDDLALGDRVNMAYKGTVATRGRAVGVVVATGMETELGRIAALLSAAKEPPTPLQRRLAALGRRLAVAAIAICVVVFAAGVMRGEPVTLMFLTALSLAVAAIPEALPAVVTVSLALGARRMVRERALIRRLPAVEALGSVTVICSDKTGTLTQNRMHVDRLWAAGEGLDLAHAAARAEGEPWRTLFRALALCNDAEPPGESAAAVGDPTEIALAEAAARAGFDKRRLEAEAKRVAEVPFDSDRKRMTTFHGDGGGVMSYTKGAPEALLGLCCRGDDEAEALEEARRMAADGLRVLAVAYRRWDGLPAALDADGVECDLVFLGLVGLIDPPRPEAADAVALCRSAGITPVMITGDHPATAEAIAERLGIADAGAEVMSGPELGRLDDAELESRAAATRVYARVAPEQKIRIVETLQRRGEIVAMTGDGVNDAPALRRADIGVAMGLGGTDVAREAAHMILLDDNFATIVAAVREGRRIYDNMRKFVRYAVTCNSGEIWTIFLAPFLGLPVPLLPIQILWINLVTDGLPGLALASEPHEGDVMERPPRPPRESIFAHGLWQHVLWVGVLMAAITLGVQAWAYEGGSERWRTMVFTVLALAQIAHVLAIRSETRSLFCQGLLSNRPLVAAAALTVGLQIAVIYVPWAQPVFRTQPLSAVELAFCFAAAALIFVAVEVEKALRRRGWLER